jgi:dihydropteroate synthase
MHLQCGAFKLSLERALVMGVVNVTPDSFSDGGLYASTGQAVAHARRLAEEGADILDIGGESTRPGSRSVDLDEERRRVLPVLDALADCGVPLSIDTRKPELMTEAIAAGAAMVNDVTALAAPAAVARAPVAVCLMHMQGEPGTMQEHPTYRDVVREVREFLGERVAAAERAGIALDRIVVDPGFGFGKTDEHNLALLRALGEFRSLGVALMAGLSRKAMLGRLTGREPRERVHASVAAALLAVQNGAQIVRVHDVAATRDALAVWNAVKLRA